MNPRVVAATARRVLRQLRHDPRTIALLVVVPLVLMSVMKGMFIDRPMVFQRVGVPLLGVFPLSIMFLITSVTMLRERTSGTLERLMTMPLAKLDILLGYGIAFGLVAAMQTSVTVAFGFGVLGLEAEGPFVAIIALAVLNALLGTAFGLFVSAFANSEFQAVQFMPAFLFPQLLLSGLMTPRASMSRGLEIASDFLPITYAYDALARVAAGSGASGRVLADVAILAGVMIGVLALGALTLRRRTG